MTQPQPETITFHTRPADDEPTPSLRIPVLNQDGERIGTAVAQQDGTFLWTGDLS